MAEDAEYTGWLKANLHFQASVKKREHKLRYGRTVRKGKVDRRAKNEWTEQKKYFFFLVKASAFLRLIRQPHISCASQISLLLFCFWFFFNFLLIYLFLFGFLVAGGVVALLLQSYCIWFHMRNSRWDLTDELKIFCSQLYLLKHIMRLLVSVILWPNRYKYNYMDIYIK